MSDYTIFWSVFFFKQKTAYEMRISDWSSDVCSSDLNYQCRHYVGGFAGVCTWVCHLRLCALRAIFACCRWASFCSRPSFRFDPTILLPVARELCELCHSRSVRAARKDRTSVVSGNSVSVRVNLVGILICKTKIIKITQK